MKFHKMLISIYVFINIPFLSQAYSQSNLDQSSNTQAKTIPNKSDLVSDLVSDPSANDNYLELELDTPSDYDAAQNNSNPDANAPSDYDEIEKIEGKNNLVPAKTTTDTTTSATTISADPNVIAPSKSAATVTTTSSTVKPTTTQSIPPVSTSKVSTTTTQPTSPVNPSVTANASINSVSTTTTTQSSSPTNAAVTPTAGHATITSTTTAKTASNVHPPMLKTDTITTQEDSSIIIKGSYLLSNDSDADGDKLTIISVKPPRNGRAVLIGHNIIYTPNSDFHGLDPIHYTVSDPEGKTAEGLVNINVTAMNDTPDISPILDQEVKPGEEINLKSGKYFDDEEGSKLEYSATGLPPGLSIDHNGLISGKIPYETKGGEYHVTVYAVDPSGATATNEFTYLVVTPSVDTTLYSDSETKSLITTAPAGEEVKNTDPQVNRTPESTAQPATSSSP